MKCDKYQNGSIIRCYETIHDKVFIFALGGAWDGDIYAGN